jgi:hypothetical protein
MQINTNSFLIVSKSGRNVGLTRMSWVLRSAVVLVLLVVGMLSAAVGGASAAGWLSPEDVPLSVSDLAFDAQGNATAVGVGADAGGLPAIVAMTRPFGGQWSAPVPVSGSDDTDAAAPHVAVNTRGDAVAVWSADNAVAVNGVVEVASRPAGGAWTDPVVVSDGAIFDHEQEVAIDAQGNATVAWAEIPGAVGFLVRAASRPSGGDWSEPVDLGGGTLHSSPRLTVDAQGDVTAVWLGERAASGGGFVNVVQSKSLPLGGTWSANAVELSSVDGAAQAPQLAADSTGDAVAVWVWHGSGGYVAQAARRVAGGDWSAPVDLGTGGDADAPQVAVDPQGDATAIWASPAASGSVVRSRSSTLGGPWGSAINLATSNDDDNVGFPWVAVDSQDNVTAIWARYNSGGVTAQAARRVGASNWSAPVDLAVSPINQLPAAGIDPQGNTTMVWSRSGSPWSGSSTIFDPVAPELRGLTAPAGAVVGQPVAMSVNPFDDWSAVTTSWDFGDGQTAAGAAVTHTYGSPGERTVTVTGVDAAGNTTQTSRTITVDPVPVAAGPGPSPGPGPGPVLALKKAPVISGLRQSGARWRTHAVKRGPRLPVGTTFRFTLDRAAQVRFAFSQIVSGRRVGGRCVKVTKANRGKSRCDRSQSVGTLSVTGKAGANAVAFRGRLAGRTLAPGRYRLLVTALGDGKTSAAAATRFTIVG